MFSFYLTCLIFIFVVLGSVLKAFGINISFLRYLKEELLIVLGTSSEKLEKLGCSESIVGLVIPTGYSFNLDVHVFI